MKGMLNRLAGAVDDRLNPIVVKELRQAVRGRFLAAVLLFFLAVQVVILGVFLLDGTGLDAIGGQGKGAEVFVAVVVVLLLATMFCIPLFAGVRLAIERVGDGLDLLYISTLEPRRIIAGKLVASAIVVLLIFSACLPFLSFTYFLRGIDLLSVMVVLVLDFLVSLTAIMAMIFIACLPTSRWFKVLLGLGSVNGLLIAFGATVAYSTQLPRMGVGSLLGSTDFWLQGGSFLVIDGLVLGLLFVLSTALISPPVLNRALPVRLFLTFAWLVSGGLAVLAAAATSDQEYLTLWMVLALGVAAVGILSAVSSRDQMSRRVAREIPRHPLGRVLAFPFWSCAASGVAWSILLAMLTLLVASVAVSVLGFSGEAADFLVGGSGFVAYVVAYSLTALLLHRRLLAGRVPHRHTWVVATFLATAGSIVPMLIAALMFPQDFFSKPGMAWMVLNPLSPFVAEVEDLSMAVGPAWAALMVVLAGTWFGRQMRSFKPPPPEPVPALDPPSLGDGGADAGRVLS